MFTPKKTPSASAPAPAPQPEAPAPSEVAAITIDTDAGTLVEYKPVVDLRPNAVGVVLKKSGTDLEIVWTTDGAKETVDPELLQLSGVDNAPAPAPAPRAATPPSVFGTDRSVLSRSNRTHRELITEKFPTDLFCPLDSVDTEIESFRFRMDNYMCAGHPKIRQLILGHLEPPLLTYGPYLDYMRERCTDGVYVYDHTTADKDIREMRLNDHDKLADECELILDNPPALDGFRPCNNVVYYALVKSLKPDDVHIL